MPAFQILKYAQAIVFMDNKLNRSDAYHGIACQSDIEPVAL